ncbi:MAG: hypothetical protein U0525_01450 [Patescibacteria group bacterium]
MSSKKTSFIALLFVFISTIYISSNIFAQTITPVSKPGINVTLSPVFMNVSVQAGTTKRYSFKVTNNNSFDEVYRIAVIKYQPDNKGSIIPSEFTTTPDPTLSWFKFPVSKVTVPAKATEKIEFDISPAKDAFLGYYFGIAVERAAENYTEGGTTRVVGAPTIPVLLEVTRMVGKDLVGIDADSSKYKQGVLTSFKTTSSWYEELPTEFEVTFKNTGKIHLVPFGEIFINQGKGTEIANIPINESNGNTLPNSQRTYKSIWNDGFIVREPIKEADGQYRKDKNGNLQYKTQIYWDKLTKFRIGRYSAHAVLVYNNGQFDVPLEADLAFWIIPWKIILVIAILIALIIFGLRNLVIGLLRS